MTYLSAALTAGGIIAVVAGWALHQRERIDRLVAYRWYTVGWSGMALGTLIKTIRSAAPDVSTTIYVVSLCAFAAALTHVASRAAIPCMFGHHSRQVVNKVAAITEAGDVAELDVLWDPDGGEDRDLLLSSLLRHGHVVESRCADCGKLIAKHTGA